MIVTIDGPAGAGKSTLAKKIAQEFNFVFINSGALYRAIAYYLLENSVKVENVEATLKDIEIKIDKNFKEIFLNGKNVSKNLYTPEVSKIASLVAKNKAVRDFVNNIIRNFAKGKNVIIEGRDTGSVIFPNADIKFYLDANINVRAERRYKELIEKGIKVDFEKLKNEIEKRDHEDKTRKIAPLIIPKDAIYIDTSHLTFEQVYEKVKNIILQYQKEVKNESNI